MNQELRICNTDEKMISQVKIKSNEF